MRRRRAARAPATARGASADARAAQDEAAALDEARRVRRRRRDGLGAASPADEADDDLALLEEIFASKPPPAKARAADRAAGAGGGAAEPASLKKVSLLEDSRRAANVAIGLEYFSRQYRGDDDALCRAVASLSEWLDGPKLRSLQVQLPTPEEEALVRSYVDDAANDAARLARPERFFAAALRWPRFAARVEAACFRAEFDEQAWTRAARRTRSRPPSPRSSGPRASAACCATCSRPATR